MRKRPLIPLCGFRVESKDSPQTFHSFNTPIRWATRDPLLHNIKVLFLNELGVILLLLKGLVKRTPAAAWPSAAAATSSPRSRGHPRAPTDPAMLWAASAEPVASYCPPSSRRLRRPATAWPRASPLRCPLPVDRRAQQTRWSMECPANATASKASWWTGLNSSSSFRLRSTSTCPEYRAPCQTFLSVRLVGSYPESISSNPALALLSDMADGLHLGMSVVWVGGSVTRKNCQMSIKVARKWFHKKN